MSEGRRVPALVGVPVATLWAAPTAPLERHAGALTPGGDVLAWMQRLELADRHSIVGRALTQMLWGDPVLVEREEDGWALVVATRQPSSLDPRGYPGWVPRHQLVPWVPAPRGCRRVVTALSSAVHLDRQRSSLSLSFGTELYRSEPALAGPRGLVAARSRTGHSLWLPAEDWGPVDDTAGTAAVVSSALAFLGVPYLWGGTSGGGVDCSGLVSLVARRHGTRLPRDAADQALVGEAVGLDMLAAGDLMFFTARGAPGAHHVAMAVGEHHMVHAPRTGSCVEIAPVAAERYATDTVHARRHRWGSRAAPRSLTR